MPLSVFVLAAEQRGLQWSKERPHTVIHTDTIASVALRQALLQGQQTRLLNVHEYISMDLMKNFGIGTPVVSAPTTSFDMPMRTETHGTAVFGGAPYHLRLPIRISVSDRLRRAGACVQGHVCSTVDEAEHAYVNTLGKGDVVIKAQVRTPSKPKLVETERFSECVGGRAQGGGGG